MMITNNLLFVSNRLRCSGFEGLFQEALSRCTPLYRKNTLIVNTFFGTCGSKHTEKNKLSDQELSVKFQIHLPVRIYSVNHCFSHH